jgi:hypothetical protein
LAAAAGIAIIIVAAITFDVFAAHTTGWEGLVQQRTSILLVTLLDVNDR